MKIGKALSKVIENNYDGLSSKKAEILKDIDAVLVKQVHPESINKCPECGRNFSVITVRDLQIECCKFCQSIWFDDNELKSFTGFSRDIPADDYADRKSKYKCPECGLQMNEYLFLKRSNLLVDKCREGHGVYLESGELARALKLSE